MLIIYITSVHTPEHIQQNLKPNMSQTPAMPHKYHTLQMIRHKPATILCAGIF